MFPLSKNMGLKETHDVQSQLCNDNHMHEHSWICTSNMIAMNMQILSIDHLKAQNNGTIVFHIVLGPTPSVKEGRGALLGAIWKGKALNKVEPPPASKPGL